jgi:hypothetical protein
MRRVQLAILAVIPLLAGVTPVRAASGTYLLPFPTGTRVYVAEGNSEGDHAAPNGEQYAFDFSVEASLVTPVVTAARAGTVIGAQTPGYSNGASCATWACWTRAPFVLVDQGDGTSALYEFAGPTVKVGAQVTQGQQIGAITSSGFSVTQHLLFQVENTPTVSERKASGWWHTISQPISFADADVVARTPSGIPTRQGGPYIAGAAGTSALATATAPTGTKNLASNLSRWTAGAYPLPPKFGDTQGGTLSRWSVSGDGRFIEGVIAMGPGYAAGLQGCS